MFSFPSGLLDLFYCFWPNVRRLFRRITRKGLLAPVAKRLYSLPRRISKSTSLMLFPVIIYRWYSARRKWHRRKTKGQKCKNKKIKTRKRVHRRSSHEDFSRIIKEIQISLGIRSLRTCRDLNDGAKSENKQTPFPVRINPDICAKAGNRRLSRRRKERGVPPASFTILMFAMVLRLWGCYDNCNERLEIPRAHLRPRVSASRPTSPFVGFERRNTLASERAAFSVQTRELLSTELVRIDLSAEC